MQRVVKEILKMSSLVKANGAKVKATPDQTQFVMVDESKDLVVYMTPKEPIRQFRGVFGVQMKTLDNLLSHDGFDSDNLDIEYFNRPIPVDDKTNMPEMEVPKSIKFKGKRGASAVFFFSHGTNIIGADYPNIPFHVELDISKEALEEFRKLSVIFDASTSFRLSIDEQKRVICEFGIDGHTTHHGSMVLVENVRGSMTKDLAWDVARFNSILKTIGSSPATISVSNHKVLKIVTNTELCRYEYWLRCVKL